MRETIEALLKRVRQLAEALAGTGGREEWEETEESASAPVEVRRRRNAAHRGLSGPRESREMWEEEAGIALLRREVRGETARRGRERGDGEENPGREEALQARGDEEWARALREETEGQPDGAGRSGDAREYGFGDGTDPSRYFYSEDYLERLSGYLETDARRYGPRNME